MAGAGDRGCAEGPDPPGCRALAARRSLSRSAAVDMNVIVFLLGLMLVVGYLEEASFFEWPAGSPARRR